MTVKGDFPIGQLPLLPQSQATTQTQVSGVNGVSDRTVTTPEDDLPLTIGAITVNISVSMMTPGNILSLLQGAGVEDVELDRDGFLILPETPTGDSDLLNVLGF